MTTSIMIVGVGGQGTLLASKIIGRVATDMGYDVKVSEVHGMSQRGGSVVTYVKFGDEVFSPIIDDAGADVVLAFEELEGYRYLRNLKKGGKLLINTQQIDPMPVIVGSAEYPKDIIKKIEDMGINLTAVDALPLARQAGNEKTVNVVLLGALAASTEIEKDKWIQAVRDTVPARFLDVNLKAFDLGYQILKKGC